METLVCVINTRRTEVCHAMLWRQREKYPNARTAWNRRYLFSSRRGSIDPQTRSVGRQHGSDTWIGKHFTRAVKGSGLVKRVTVYTLRHSFVMHLLADGADMRTVLNLVSHKDLRSEMTHKHVVQYSARVRASSSSYTALYKQSSICANNHVRNRVSPQTRLLTLLTGSRIGFCAFATATLTTRKVSGIEILAKGAIGTASCSPIPRTIERFVT